jgi:hypothetical protein
MCVCVFVCACVCIDMSICRGRRREIGKEREGKMSAYIEA